MHRALLGVGGLVVGGVALVAFLRNRAQTAQAAATRVPANAAHPSVVGVRSAGPVQGTTAATVGAVAAATPSILQGIFDSFKPSPVTLENSGDSYATFSDNSPAISSPLLTGIFDSYKSAPAPILVDTTGVTGWSGEAD